ncbi:MAG: secretin and TonB N-terminal domain-containing protein [Verrucomicrobia bacterium]|nr:secretin and TonB N-terminal domain-containing protein [Verrucomicrobiota bacterium]
MKKKSKVYCRATGLLLWICVFALGGQVAVFAQDAPDAGTADDSQKSETVTIHVKNANIAEVLRAYSLQTRQNMVVGPDVVSDNVNVQLTDAKWDEALDVILKPYGFGYRMVGDTIVISRLENIVQVEGIEPLASKVFKLKYLDAYDIKEVCEAQLTSRGKFTIMSNKGLPGWEFGGGSSSGRSSSRAVSNIGTAQRKKAEPIEKSKTIVITDVPSSLTAIGTILEELDQEPSQVLIEAKFIEIDTGVLRDLGIDFATGQNDPLSRPGVEPSNTGVDNQWGFTQNESLVEPAAFASLSDNLASAIDYNSGLQLLFSRVAGENFDILLHALEEDGDANILSAPKILTLDNQEAAILVGTKFPIIQSDSTGGTVTGGNVSTSLDYYENVGIQLNVIPQVSNDEYINMIVKPAVSTIDGFESGVVSTGEGGGGALTRYPILKVREAQTQVLLKSGDSAVIGGLQEERDRESVHKVPFLGDIPFLGVLFKRTTTNKQKIELLIFVKASIVENEAYAVESAKLNDEWEARIGVNVEEEEVVELSDEEIAEVENVVAPAEVETEGVDVPAETPDAEKEEMVTFVNGSSGTAEEAAPVESEEM